jgi:hypothetical protein
LFVVDPALVTFAASKERSSFPQRGIGLFAFLQERQKYPDYPVNPVLFERAYCDGSMRKHLCRHRLVKVG